MIDVRFTPESGHARLRKQCLSVLLADIGARHLKELGDMRHFFSFPRCTGT
jgi:hypothetical protein